MGREEERDAVSDYTKNDTVHEPQINEKTEATQRKRKQLRCWMNEKGG